MSRALRAAVAIDGLGIPESLRWHDGHLFFSDMALTNVHRWNLRDSTSEVIAEIPGRPGGLGWLPDGSLLAVSMDEGRVYRRSIDGRLTVHADVSELIRGTANDMFVAEDGHAYVGSYGFDFFGYVAEHKTSSLFAPPGPPRIGLVHLSPEGDILDQSDPIAFPNGGVIHDASGTFVVAESLTMRLREFDREPDGSLAPRGTWAPLIADRLWDALTSPGVVGRIARTLAAATDRPAIAERSASPISPDGICLGHDGTIWVANALRSECVEVERGGRILRRVATSHPALSCVLGGADERTLFISTAPSSHPQQARAAMAGRVEVFELD